MGEGRGGADTESEAGSKLRAVSTEPNAGLELMDHEIMTWAEVGRLTDQATQAPLFFLIFNVYLERDGVHKQGRGRKREGLIEFEAGSRLWIVSTEPNMGLEPRNCELMTWAEVRHLKDWATQVPHPSVLLRFNWPIKL